MCVCVLRRERVEGRKRGAVFDSGWWMMVVVQAARGKAGGRVVWVLVDVVWDLFVCVCA